MLPESYRAVPTDAPDLYVPLSTLVLPTITSRGDGNALAVLGRLPSGTTREQAQTAVSTLGQQLEQEYPRDNRGMGRPARLVPLQVLEFAGWQQPLLISSVLLTLFGFQPGGG